MRFSIIIPVYSVVRYLTQCLDSVLNQSYSDYEILLIDDGSVDGSSEICDRYLNLNENIIVIHKMNGGLSDARNHGIFIAAGDYGIFIDSDDFWNDENALQKINTRLEETQTQLLNFSYFKFYEDTNKTIKMVQAENMPLSYNSYNEQMEYIMNNGLYIASACNKVISKDVLKSSKFEVGKYSEDIKWAALVLSNIKSIDYINLCFYCYRQRSGSISQSINKKTCIDLAYAIKECCQIAESNYDNDIKQKYLREYAAYQFATFVAVQAFTTDFEKEIIQELIPYVNILKYYRNKKVKYMYYGVKLFSLNLWCRIIRLTKSIWDSRRDRI